MREIERDWRREEAADSEAKRQKQNELHDPKRAGLHLLRAADRSAVKTRAIQQRVPNLGGSPGSGLTERDGERQMERQGQKKRERNTKADRQRDERRDRERGADTQRDWKGQRQGETENLLRAPSLLGPQAPSSQDPLSTANVGFSWWIPAWAVHTAPLPTPARRHLPWRPCREKIRMWKFISKRYQPPNPS